ncbi:MAG: hypothetical protein ACHQT6_12520, partial [Candidatus Acidiferrales bacterium]
GILRSPSGAFLKMSPHDLAGSPFSDFFIPGLFLLVLLGCGSAVAALLLWRLPGRFSWVVAVGISITLLAWLAVQLAIVGYRGFLQVLYGCLGVILLALLAVPSARVYWRH